MNDIAWILFEGQSTDSLISNCRTILWFAGGGDTIWIWNSDQRMRLTKLLDECTELRRGRNVVIHGTWSDFCEYEDYEDRECELRPPDSPQDGRIYFFKRSKQRMPVGDTHLAIIDIETLADQFEAMDSRMRTLQREAREAQRRRWKLRQSEGE